MNSSHANNWTNHTLLSTMNAPVAGGRERNKFPSTNLTRLRSRGGRGKKKKEKGKNYCSLSQFLRSLSGAKEKTRIESMPGSREGKKTKNGRERGGGASFLERFRIKGTTLSLRPLVPRNWQILVYLVLFYRLLLSSFASTVCTTDYANLRESINASPVDVERRVGGRACTLSLVSSYAPRCWEFPAEK